MKKMVVKLFTTSTGFPAIRYNMDKVRDRDAQLLCMENLGVLNAYSDVKTADLEHYFGAVATQNSKSRYDQFHAVLSAPGLSMDQKAFMETAQKWLGAMGYVEQPYLVFFHTDTANRHIHIVSTDVRLDGSKISDSFDRVRAITHLNRICGVDEQADFKSDINRLLDYRCSSTDQLKILLERNGYRFFAHKDQFLIRRYGKTFLRLDAGRLSQGLSTSAPDKNRAVEIRSLIAGAMKLHSGKPFAIYESSSVKGAKKTIAYRSDLADFLHMSAGIEVCYLFSAGAVNGFVLIDHQNRQLFDGKQIMELSRFTLSPSENPSLIRSAIFQR